MQKRNNNNLLQYFNIGVFKFLALCACQGRTTRFNKNTYFGPQFIKKEKGYPSTYVCRGNKNCSRVEGYVEVELDPSVSVIIG